LSNDPSGSSKGLLKPPAGEIQSAHCDAVEAMQSMVPIEALEKLCTSFQRSARRWEVIVYPSIVAFIAMMAGAFFFIYTITSDMRDLALQMQPQVGYNLIKVADSVSLLSKSLDQMSRDIELMRVKMETMSADVSSIAGQMAYMKNLEVMNAQMAQMNATMYGMNAQADAMRWNMQSMNRSIGKPMSMFNSFMPW
jgi:methyl-accepting chemotaxis protein